MRRPRVPTFLFCKVGSPRSRFWTVSFLVRALFLACRRLPSHCVLRITFVLPHRLDYKHPSINGLVPPLPSNITGISWEINSVAATAAITRNSLLASPPSSQLLVPSTKHAVITATISTTAAAFTRTCLVRPSYSTHIYKYLFLLSPHAVNFSPVFLIMVSALFSFHQSIS
nr:leukemia NUP98 fusion partner 1 isoform X2 [Delphinus delphis]